MDDHYHNLKSQHCGNSLSVSHQQKPGKMLQSLHAQGGFVLKAHFFVGILQLSTYGLEADNDLKKTLCTI